MNQFFSRQFLYFICTGGVAALVNFSSRILYNQWIGFSASVIAAYITGMVTAFLLARIFVFKNSQQAMHRSIGFFVLINLFAVLQTWVISVCFAYYLFPSIGVEKFVREMSHAVGIAIPVFTSYIGHKNWSFK